MTTTPLASPITGDVWIGVRDADSRAMQLFRRHYTFQPYRDNRRRLKPNMKFVGPGSYLVLLAYNCDALFVWRKFIDKSGQRGVNCAIFHNESPLRSSDLIREASERAWQKWPGERLYTYVNGHKLRAGNTNPGCCFKAAGWKLCGRTQEHGLLIFEILPPGYGDRAAVDATARAEAVTS